MKTAQRIYAMLGNESLWAVANRCSEILSQANVAHAIYGDVAVCLHGYHRNTTDIDLIISKSDSSTVKALLEADGFVWDAAIKEFRSPSDIPVQFLMAGDQAGKSSEVTVPEPTGDLNVELIAIRKLDASFARFLHKSLRSTFRELVHNARSTDD